MNNTPNTAPIILQAKQIASWFQDAACDMEFPAPIIASVPKLQRGLVWEPSQTELLWDSLLRGFPIGSLVVCPRILGQDDGDKPAVTHHLLDGQQRSHAISLGFHDPFDMSSNSPAESILWIDLMPEIPEQATREFLVRHTTSAHPWGFTRSDSCEVLRMWQIREILGSIGLDPAHPDYRRPQTEELFPAEAAVPVPMAWLLLQNSDDQDSFWNGLLEHCKTKDTVWTTNSREFLADPSDEAKEARQHLFDAVQRFRMMQVVALPAPDSLVNETRSEASVSGAAGENSAIEHLFQRLNRQGTKLDGEELAYSMIKAYWPKVAKPIQEILIRRMPASRLVMIAARAALTAGDATHLRSPLSVSDIRCLASTNGEDANRVLEFIEERLGNCCKWVEDYLLFHPQSHPHGLLPVHLANIARSNPEIYLLLLCLANRHLQAGDSSESTESLRGTIFTLVCRIAWFSADSHQTANHVLAACAGGVSSSAISAAMSHAEEQGWLLELPHPLELSILLDFEDREIESWTWYSPIYGEGMQEGIDIRQKRWGAFLSCLHNRDLLLYSQREFIARRFPDYDPSRRDLWAGHNRPWDFDHIHASAFVHNKKADNRYRRFVKQWVNTLGNLRAWPFEDNRSDSAVPADTKILTSAQLTDSFILAEEIPALSMGRKPLNDEASSLAFASTCRDRMIRIYHHVWIQLQ